MEEDEEEEYEYSYYDDFYYDDGRFADNGEEEEEYDDSDIPTYDELDLEGRYYEHGSREDYNAWRNSVIHGRNYVNRPYTSDDSEYGVVIFVVAVIAISLILYLAY